jgi:hypothetical protein
VNLLGGKTGGRFPEKTPRHQMSRSAAGASGGQAQDSAGVVLEQATLDAVARVRGTNLSIAVSDGARDPLLL